MTYNVFSGTLNPTHFTSGDCWFCFSFFYFLLFSLGSYFGRLVLFLCFFVLLCVSLPVAVQSIALKCSSPKWIILTRYCICLSRATLSSVYFLAGSVFLYTDSFSNNSLTTAVMCRMPWENSSGFSSILAWGVSPGWPSVSYCSFFLGWMS